MTSNTTVYKSMKEFWADPVRNRRVHEGGRREADFAVCVFHDSKMSEDGKHHEQHCVNIAAVRAESNKHIELIKAEHESDIMRLHQRADTDVAELRKEHDNDMSKILESVAAVSNRLTILDGRIIGKWTFWVVLILVLALVGLTSLNNSFMLNRMAKDIDDVQSKVDANNITMARIAAAVDIRLGANHN